MLKRFLAGALVLVTTLAAVGWLFREQVGMALLALRIAPGHDFSASLLPPAPDYVNDNHWAALPGLDDPSDAAPAGAGRDDTRRAGVFFIHPTSYFGKTHWNQPLDDERANWITDQRVLRNQASVFNGCCEVFAPRYRQATFFSFMDDQGNGTQALDIAYLDVAAAFDNFLKRNGNRPYILAGHSQGARHAARLLREKIAGTALADKLIAAYPVGYAIEEDQVGGLPVCTAPEATGCVLGWNATEGNGSGLYPSAGKLICVNPLTWATDGVHAGNDLNLGGIGFASYISPGDDEDLSAMAIEPGVADAQCVNRTLSVASLRSERFPSRLPGNSMHVYDYGLFYMNIRENARQRTHAFLQHNGSSHAPGDNY